ncbi:MAG: carboxymuconolactone decarboxylase family protein, partial [Hyphomicrobiales bacterium]|nr:carboxymuconolactone decarboxylase family protein [Hyphomicrobiales bacterium]
GRTPKSAPRDERAIYTFVKELYARRRVSNSTYTRVHKLLGDAGIVELTGILGYYAMISMILNVFRMPVPEGVPAPFKEPILPTAY